ncbi:MAG: hypothetical protein IPM25_01895 [Chloracidobacterium sp.]|nr:hypothetical protein [Chloracidobacterium sp.]
MIKLRTIAASLAFIIGIVAFGGLFGSRGNLSTNAQVVSKVEKRTVKGTKTVYRATRSGVKKGLRIGHQVGSRVWTGTKWVGVNSWRGGRWVARKTASGVKWTYYKARGKRKRVP